MDVCFLRGLLFAALTAWTLGDGTCLQQKPRSQRKMLACLLTVMASWLKLPEYHRDVQCYLYNLHCKNDLTLGSYLQVDY